MILIESEGDSSVINVVMDDSGEFFALSHLLVLIVKSYSCMRLLGLRFHPGEEQDLVAERSACVPE